MENIFGDYTKECLSYREIVSVELEKRAVHISDMKLGSTYIAVDKKGEYGKPMVLDHVDHRLKDVLMFYFKFPGGSEIGYPVYKETLKSIIPADNETNYFILMKEDAKLNG